ncbi:hypothetical protein KI387_037476, partial [Taxus chinensis]
MGNCCSSSEQDESMVALDSIMKSIPDTVDPVQTLDPLIELIDKQVERIKATSLQKASTSASSSSSGIALESMSSMASVMRLAAQVIDKIKTEAGNLQDSQLLKVIGSGAVKAAKLAGESHWIFLALSVTAYALEEYVKIKENESKCIELLENIVELAKDLRNFVKPMPEERERVRKAVRVIVEGAVTCCDYIARGNASRYWYGVDTQLQSTKDSIKDIHSTLTFAGVNRLLKEITLRPQQSPLDPLHFDPVGIEEKIPELTKMLDMEGSDPVVALVLYGFGGIGKSTLAASLIQRLNLTSTGFKYCKVIIDGKTTDPTSHIMQLQADIVRDIGDKKLSIRNPDEGRMEVQKVIQNKRCLLYIDNVVDIDYVRELLPRQLSPAKLRMVITSRQGNLKTPLDMKPIVYKDYPVKVFTTAAAKSLLYKTILGSEVKPHTHFDEEGLIDQVAVACAGVPILLDRFGKHLSDLRDQENYKEAIEALREGDFSEYSYGSEEQLGEKLWYLYRKMTDKEAQEAFLDICTYYYGWSWDIVGHIVGKNKLQLLEKRMLVTKSDTDDKLIVHDILRMMGTKEAPGTRFTTYRQFSEALRDESNLQNVKGVSLRESSSIESRHLNAMHSSLRVLILGDWVTLNGPTCERAFENLRYLQLGDIPTFPFKDASKLKKLAGFHNNSLPGLLLAVLPQTVKYMRQNIIKDVEFEGFERFPLQHLRSLENFTVEVYRRELLKLPEGLNLQPSLVTLHLKGCDQVPEKLSHLTALRRLTLENCNLKVFPKEIGQLVRLEHLNMASNEELTSLGVGFGSPNSLITLNLRGCKLLETLPPNLGLLSSLKTLDLAYCTSLKELPEMLGGLSSLQQLDLEGCRVLEKLSADFGTLTSLKQLNLQFCKNLRALPEYMGGLSLLSDLNVSYCERLEKLPVDLGNLTSLKQLDLSCCSSLKELPPMLGQLSSVQQLDLSWCTNLENLSADFGTWTSLKQLDLHYCKNLRALPEYMGGLSLLSDLNLHGCGRLEKLSVDFERLTSLKKLDLSGCRDLEKVSVHFEMLTSLEELNLQLHENMSSLSSLPQGLETLTLSDCDKLITLPEELCALQKLKKFELEFCTSFCSLPTGFGKLSSLEAITIRDCPSLKELPPGFESLSALQCLILYGCRSLVKLPTGFEKLPSLMVLEIEDCVNMEGAAMDKIINLPQCYEVRISGCTQLMERWREIERSEDTMTFASL